ncbi:hypothetical protein D2E44_20830 [Mycobacteroides abscessus]|nr:hypothetical protein D2E44_20830 [Mycobacteroides abscessus]
MHTLFPQPSRHAVAVSTPLAGVFRIPFVGPLLAFILRAELGVRIRLGTRSLSQLRALELLAELLIGRRVVRNRLLVP